MFGIFEDDFPFPQVGYVNFLEGISNQNRFWRLPCKINLLESVWNQIYQINGFCWRNLHWSLMLSNDLRTPPTFLLILKGSIKRGKQRFINKKLSHHICYCSIEKALAARSMSKKQILLTTRDIPHPCSKKWFFLDPLSRKKTFCQR